MEDKRERQMASTCVSVFVSSEPLSQQEEENVGSSVFSPGKSPREAAETVRGLGDPTVEGTCTFGLYKEPRRKQES